MRIKLVLSVAMWVITNPIKALKGFKGIAVTETLNKPYTQQEVDAKITKLGIKQVHLNDLLSNKQDVKLFPYGNTSLSITYYELMSLCSIAADRNVKSILEIGTYEGSTAVNLANNTDAIVHTLNLPQEFETFEVGKYNKHNDRVFQLFGDSTVYNSKLKYDLIFIDGNHNYEGVKTDTKRMLSYLNENGIMVWHDFDKVIHRYTMVGMMDALIELNRKDIKLYKIIGTNLLVAIRGL